jgi:hypothetical protein
MREALIKSCFEGYGLKPVHKRPANTGALAPEGPDVSVAGDLIRASLELF